MTTGIYLKKTQRRLTFNHGQIIKTFSCETAHCWKCLTSIFHEFCSSIDQIFIFGGRLSIMLQVYRILRFY